MVGPHGRRDPRSPSGRVEPVLSAAPVIAVMKDLSAQYPHHGYRRIRIFLRQCGFELSWSRAHRRRR
jgi:putative transposase